MLGKCYREKWDWYLNERQTERHRLMQREHTTSLKVNNKENFKFKNIMSVVSNEA